MKAIQLQAIQTLNRLEAPLPQTGPDEVLLRVIACALCRTDAKMWRQGHRDLVLPRVLGHEICGRGGDEDLPFVVWPGSGCGVCPDCLSGAENLCPAMCILGFHRDGGLAEYVAVPKSSLIPVPQGLPVEVACLAEPLACAVNALEQAEVSRNEHVLIYGAGPVGLLMALAAQITGADPMVTERDPMKLRLSDRFRKETGISAERDTERSNFDVVVNAAPTLDALRDGLSRLRSRGRYCLFSGLPHGGSIDAGALNEIHYRQLRCVGAYGCTRRQMEKAVEMLMAHASEAALLIQERIEIEQVPAALPRILDGQVLKTVVHFNIQE
jgi:L-iditol 2-dehydrogenase